MKHKPEPPFATVLDVQGDRVTILCPLCNGQHYHSGFSAERTEHRVAACGLYEPINQTTKAIGYRYKVGK
ncbi:hypothetical protein AURUGA1_00376 [Aurantimicrobium sp. MWH-Uga1]|nr:hypothetical protein AURUGA1_00376 [Aurantimicrobium sp. MWH-Uga1]